MTENRIFSDLVFFWGVSITYFYLVDSIMSTLIFFISFLTFVFFVGRMLLKIWSKPK